MQEKYKILLKKVNFQKIKAALIALAEWPQAATQSINYYNSSWCSISFHNDFMSQLSEQCDERSASAAWRLRLCLVLHWPWRQIGELHKEIRRQRTIGSHVCGSFVLKNRKQVTRCLRNIHTMQSHTGNTQKGQMTVTSQTPPSC